MSAERGIEPFGLGVFVQQPSTVVTIGRLAAMGTAKLKPTIDEQRLVLTDAP